jgi:glycosyltransferase 2 family protein
MKTKIFNWLKKFWLILFLTSSLIFLLHYFLEQATLVSTPHYFVLRFFVLTILVHSFFWMLSSFAWQYLLLISCQLKISLFQSFSQLIFVSIGKYMPGKVWGMVARGGQLKALGLDIKSIFLISFQEQILILHASAIVSALLIGFLMQTIWGYGLMAIALFSLFLGKPIQIVFVILFNYLMKHLKKEQLNLKQTITQKHYLSLLMIYMMTWILAGCIFSGLYLTFITPNELNLNLITWMILANTIGITVGFFAFFAPAGIGVRESVSSLVLSQVMPLEQAIFLSLLFRFWIVLTELTFGIIVGYFFGKNLFKN